MHFKRDISGDFNVRFMRGTYFTYIIIIIMNNHIIMN